jgi:hypothetical protein
MLGRSARDVGILVAAVVGWVLLFLLIAAMYVGVSYALSGQPPYCPGTAQGPPPAGPLQLGGVYLIAFPAATLLVGLWWALGAATAGSRARHVVGVVVATVLLFEAVGFLVVGYVQTPFTCGLVV